MHPVLGLAAEDVLDVGDLARFVGEEGLLDDLEIADAERLDAVVDVDVGGRTGGGRAGRRRGRRRERKGERQRERRQFGPGELVEAALEGRIGGERDGLAPVRSSSACRRVRASATVVRDVTPAVVSRRLVAASKVSPKTLPAERAVPIANCWRRSAPKLSTAPADGWVAAVDSASSSWASRARACCWSVASWRASGLMVGAAGAAVVGAAGVAAIPTALDCRSAASSCGSIAGVAESARRARGAVRRRGRGDERQKVERPQRGRRQVEARARIRAGGVGGVEDVPEAGEQAVVGRVDTPAGRRRR